MVLINSATLIATNSTETDHYSPELKFTSDSGIETKFTFELREDTFFWYVQAVAVLTVFIKGIKLLTMNEKFAYLI